MSTLHPRDIPEGSGGWTDNELLTALGLRDFDGLSYAEIGKRLGRSRNAVLTMCWRIDQATEESEAGDVR